MNFFSKARIISLLVFVAVLTTEVFASQEVAPEELLKAIEEKRTQVPEFSALAELAQKNGYRLYLTGGTAAALGDFIKHHLLVEQGRMQISPERLLPNIHNVLMPDQDIDLAVERDASRAVSATAKDIHRFRRRVERMFPYRLSNGKSRWDVLGMSTDLPAGKGRGPRLALKYNSDFSKQNNDTLSIGAIELTRPPSGESVVQDLVLDPDRKSRFLEDLAGTKIRFLESRSHRLTERAFSGMNPPILSVIRTLTKAFQFQKEISAEDFEKMKKIVSSFDPSTVRSDSYVGRWIAGKGRALVIHAYDQERALRVLDEIGLKQKLIALNPKGVRKEGSLSWWLSKEALPTTSSPGASLNGNTAAAWGISEVVHFTGDVEHRLITWRYDGIPRALFSREDVVGESAADGKGFYTLIAGPGMDSSRWKIKKRGQVVRMKVDPSARFIKDFMTFKNTAAVWRNVAPLRVVHSVPAYGNSPGCATLAKSVLNQLSRLPRIRLAQSSTAAAPQQPTAAGQLSKLVLLGAGALTLGKVLDTPISALQRPSTEERAMSETVAELRAALLASSSKVQIDAISQKASLGGGNAELRRILTENAGRLRVLQVSEETLCRFARFFPHPQDRSSFLAGAGSAKTPKDCGL